MLYSNQFRFRFSHFPNATTTNEGGFRMLLHIPYYRHIEEHLSLSAKSLQRFTKAQRPIKIESDINLTFYNEGNGTLIVSFANLESDIVRQRISFSSSKVGYGERMFVSCPKCGGAVNNLYFRSYFACRVCHGLYYRSNMRQRNKLQRLKDAITNKQKKLRMSHKRRFTDRPIEKPLNMHRTTYERLLCELLALQIEYVKEKDKGLHRLYERS